MKSSCVYLILLMLIVLAVVTSGLAVATGRGCDRKTSAKGAIGEMKTYYIGRFSIDMPASTEMTARTKKLRYVEIEEIIWRKEASSEKDRMTERRLGVRSCFLQGVIRGRIVNLDLLGLKPHRRKCHD